MKPNDFSASDMSNDIQLDSDSDVSSMLKILMKEENLPFITELTFEQIVEICKLKHIAIKYGKKNFPNLNKKYPIEETIETFIKHFCLYMTSHKRKRTTEFISALKSQRDNEEKKPNFISRMTGL